jgi:hypothetical protein
MIRMNDDYVRSIEDICELSVEVVHAGDFVSFARTQYRDILREYIANKRRPDCPVQKA